MAEAKKTATLSFGNTSIELPMLTPTVGPEVVDIRKLYGEADVFTRKLLSPGRQGDSTNSGSQEQDRKKGGGN